ncbi:MAG: type II toxin-antitoxin system VapC family toxin [Verrucomicrobium sp.]
MSPCLYADSSFLVSLLMNDAGSSRALQCMSEKSTPLVFTPLHRIEVRNAVRNAAARGAITPADQNLAFRQLDEDLKDGLLIHHPLPWTEVFRTADELSENHSRRDGQRTIDLLHVAAAKVLGVDVFLSLDLRQCGLAKAAGLKVHP